MLTNPNIKIIVIGGSAGSFPIVYRILEELPKSYKIPIIICMHRLKQVHSGFVETLSMITENSIIEPFDNDLILPQKIYVCPANYHVLLNQDSTFSLSTEEPVHFSRPSIDVMFNSAAQIYKNQVLGILLSGANKDGADGLKKIKQNGGITIVQDPIQAQVAAMPNAAIELQQPDYILQTESIISFLKNLF